MYITEQVYKGGNTYNNTNKAESKCASHDSKRKVGEATSPTKPYKFHAGKRKKKYADHPNDPPTGEKTCLVYGPGHYIYCKVLKEYSEKYDVQRPHKEKEYRPGYNKNLAKNLKFDIQAQEVNAMVSHYAPIPRRRKRGKSGQK